MDKNAPVRIIARITDALALSGSAAAIAQDCAPSPWGADDEIGAANRMTSNSVLAALSLATESNVHP